MWVNINRQIYVQFDFSCFFLVQVIVHQTQRKLRNMLYAVPILIIVMIDSITYSLCLRHYVRNGLSCSGEETRLSCV